MRFALTVPLLLFAMPVAAEGPVKLLFETTACRSLNDAVRTMVLSSDPTAFKQFINPKLADGECKTLDAGTEIFRDELIGNQSCIRIGGEADCWWAMLSPRESDMLKRNQ
jgi:hypothetical protein